MKKIFPQDSIRKYLPFLLLFLLSLFLMFFFRFKKSSISSFFEESKRNLLSFYAKSLSPLITKTQIGDEDLFNFALYKSLPIDKKNDKVLVLSNDGGKQVYEIKTLPINNTKNYQTFAEFLRLDSKNRMESDSILNSYRKSIYSCILLGDKEAYAISPQIISLREALLADLIQFADKVNPEKSQKLFAFNHIDQTNFKNLISHAKDLKFGNYVLITPDTVAETNFTWDVEKFNKQMEAFEKGKMVAEEFAKNQAFKMQTKEKLNHKLSDDLTNVHFSLDSDFYKVMVNENNLSKFINDTITLKLNEVAEKLKKISIVPPRPPRAVRPGQKSIPQIHSNNEEDVMQIVDPYMITEQTLKMVKNLNIPRIIETAMKLDTSFQNEMKDSLKSKKIKETLKKANKELKKNNLDTLKY